MQEEAEEKELFLGHFLPENCMLLVIACHAAVCVFFIATTSSVVQVDVAGYTITPELQIGLSCWSLFGIFTIMGAIIGLNWGRVFPVTLYFGYLIVSGVMLAAISFDLVRRSGECVFVKQDLDTQRLGNAFSCSIITGMVVLICLTLQILAGFSCYVVWMVKEDLWRSQERGESSSLLLRDSKAKDLMRGSWNSLPTQGRQRAWGTIGLRTTDLGR